MYVVGEVFIVAMIDNTATEGRIFLLKNMPEIFRIFKLDRNGM